MSKLISEIRNLNIRHDLPPEVWSKVPDVYQCMEGWSGFGDGDRGLTGIPYWYGFGEDGTHISASLEPSGLQFFVTNIEEQQWNLWLSRFKARATEILGFKVGEIELGEVNTEIEWVAR